MRSHVNRLGVGLGLVLYLFTSRVIVRKCQKYVNNYELHCTQYDSWEELRYNYDAHCGLY